MMEGQAGKEWDGGIGGRVMQIKDWGSGSVVGLCKLTGNGMEAGRCGVKWGEATSALSSLSLPPFL